MSGAAEINSLRPEGTDFDSNGQAFHGVKLPIVAIGRRVRKKTEGFELRVSQSAYKTLFDTEKIDIEGKTDGFGMYKKGYRNVGLARPLTTHCKPSARNLYRIPYFYADPEPIVERWIFGVCILPKN